MSLKHGVSRARRTWSVRRLCIRLDTSTVALRFHRAQNCGRDSHLISPLLTRLQNNRRARVLNSKRTVVCWFVKAKDSKRCLASEPSSYSTPACGLVAGTRQRDKIRQPHHLPGDRCFVLSQPRSSHAKLAPASKPSRFCVNSSESESNFALNIITPGI